MSLQFRTSTTSIFGDQNFIKSTKSTSKLLLNFAMLHHQNEQKPCDVKVWVFSGYKKPSWEVEELRWCDRMLRITGQTLAPGQGVVKAETEIKTNGVSWPDGRGCTTHWPHNKTAVSHYPKGG